METQTAITHGIVFKTETFEIHLLARDNILVVGLGVGQLGLVEVVASLGKDNPFRPDVHTDTVDGRDVLTEKLVLFERGSVDDIQVHLHTLELQFVTQGNVVDELTGLLFNHIDGIGCLKHAEIAVPHQVIGVDALHGLVDEGRVAHLNEEVVLAGIVLIV